MDPQFKLCQCHTTFDFTENSRIRILSMMDLHTKARVRGLWGGGCGVGDVGVGLWGMGLWGMWRLTVDTIKTNTDQAYFLLNVNSITTFLFF